jgi:DNA repair exonuclease SbcCD ATPase subunit
LWSVLTREITQDEKFEIIYYLLSGYRYSEIINVIDISNGSITKIVQELELVHGKNNVDLLLSFAKSLRKEQLSVIDALNGIRIHSILKSLNCSEEYVTEFLDKIVSACKSQNLSAEDLTKYSVMLFELSRSSDISLDKLEEHYSSLIQKNNEIKNSITSYEKKQKEVKTKLDDTLSHESTTIQLLDDYSTTKKKLAEFSIDVGDLDSLVSMLQESSRLDFDPHKVIEYIKKAESLETQLSTLDENINTQTSKLAQKQNELSRIQSDIDELKLQKSQLTAQNDSLQEQIIFSKDTTLSAINSIKESSVSSISDSVANASKSINSASVTSENSLNDMIKKTDETLTQITANYDSKLTKITDASTEIGKMQAIKPLYDMITESKGESIPVFINLLSLFDSLVIWQQTHSTPIGMDKHLDYLQKILRERIAKR